MFVQAYTGDTRVVDNRECPSTSTDLELESDINMAETGGGRLLRLLSETTIHGLPQLHNRHGKSC